MPEKADGRGRKPERLRPPFPTTGMGVSTVTAARILKGQLHHNPGEETRLEMDKFPHVALSKVSSSPKPAEPKPLALRLDNAHKRALARWSALPGPLSPPCEMRTAAATSQGFILRVLAH